MLLRAYDRIYSGLNHYLVFRASAQRAHSSLVGLLRLLDRMPYAKDLAGHLHDAAFESKPALVGGAQLSHPLILAAGLVKGDGFDDETAALGQSLTPGET